MCAFLQMFRICFYLEKKGIKNLGTYVGNWSTKDIFDRLKKRGFFTDIKNVFFVFLMTQMWVKFVRGGGDYFGEKKNILNFCCCFLNIEFCSEGEQQFFFGRDG